MDVQIEKELAATVAARRDLGDGHDDELIAGFLERIEKRLDRSPALQPREHMPVTPRILGSIALGIPVTAVALSDAPGSGGVAVAIVAWAAIGVANLAAAFRRR